MGKLDNKVALVTDGASNIGQATRLVQSTKPMLRGGRGQLG
jgi:hypothetical protein